MTNVEVVIPEIKLNLADLAYLRGLMPDQVRCTCPSNKTRDKLLFLGLIEEGEVSPPKTEMDAFTKKQADGWELIRSGAKSENFEVIGKGYDMIRWARKPETKKDWFITVAGKGIIKNGHGKTQISKKGCA